MRASHCLRLAFAKLELAFLVNFYSTLTAFLISDPRWEAIWSHSVRHTHGVFSLGPDAGLPESSMGLDINQRRGPCRRTAYKGPKSVAPLKEIEYGFSKILIYPIFYLLKGDCNPNIYTIII